jgi:predicted acetyltransferase
MIVSSKFDVKQVRSSRRHNENHNRHVRSRLEETVLEIKRQSMADLQKAVSQTEQKSTKLLIREREQYQRLNQDLKAQTFEEAYALLNRQEDGPEVC